MKTTFDIAPSILDDAREIARRERTTLRELVEAGLLMVIRERRQGSTYEPTDARVGGSGLSTEFQGADWSRIRAAAYGEPTRGTMTDETPKR